MSAKNETMKEIGRVAGSIGKGLLAGLAGTVAMTITQMFEKEIDNRDSSKIPADVAARVFGVEPISEKEKSKLAKEVHLIYGTTWGALRGILSESGIRGWTATACHFTLLWGTGLLLETKLGNELSVKKWKPETIATEGFHHAVYAITTGLIYDAIDATDE